MMQIRGNNDALIRKSAETDANLIAAAPDLLEALKRMDSLWAGDGYVDPDSYKSKGWLTEDCRAVWTAVRAAIAKAEGKP